MVTKKTTAAKKAKSVVADEPAPPVDTPYARRFTRADIEKVLNLADEAHAESTVKVTPFSRANLQTVLNGNLNNEYLCGQVLIFKDEIVGILIAQLHSDAITDEYSAYDSVFFIRPVYRAYADILLNAYKEWARKRGVREAYATNYYMPEFKLDWALVGQVFKVEL